jgi:hypothetical protein
MQALSNNVIDLTKSLPALTAAGLRALAIEAIHTNVRLSTRLSMIVVVRLGHHPQ